MGTTPPPSTDTTTTGAAVTPLPPAAGGSDSGSGGSVLPRDGVIVLVGVLLVGLAVAVRAIRTRERRIGFALLAFCLAYLVVLAGLVSGVTGV